MLGHFMMTSEYMTCSSHPACLCVLNNSLCFCFLEYLFICDAVCVSDLSDFIYTGCWKASLYSLSWSHWRRELYVGKPTGLKISPLASFDISYKTTQAALSWFHLQQFYHSGVFIYVSICLWIALAFCLWFDFVLISSWSPHRPWEYLPLE